MATTADPLAAASACYDAQPPDLVDDDDGAGAPVLALVVRTDTAGGADPARVDARCCSATLATYWAERDNAAVDLGVAWTRRVLACDDDAALEKCVARARACGVRAREFRDAATGERSLLALGPGAGEALAAVTGGSLVRPFPWKERAGAGEDEELAARRAETLRVTARVVAEYRSSATKTKKKMKPNDKCDCGSGLKFKKCCAGKSGSAALEDAVLTALGKEAVTAPSPGPISGKSSSEDRESSKGNVHVAQGGEKVAGFRKQVEYGAKKYIKP